MGWRDAAAPVRMQRVALVCPKAGLRDMLVRVADAGVVEIDRTTSGGGAGGTGGTGGLGGARPPGSPEPRLCATAPDSADLERAGRDDLLAGEAELASYADEAVTRDDAAALAGWVPTTELPALTSRLTEVGAGAVAIPAPRGVDPPTLLQRAKGMRRSFTPLVETYGTVPYADVDPSALARTASTRRRRRWSIAFHATARPSADASSQCGPSGRRCRWSASNTTACGGSCMRRCCL